MVPGGVPVGAAAGARACLGHQIAARSHWSICRKEVASQLCPSGAGICWRGWAGGKITLFGKWGAQIHEELSFEWTTLNILRKGLEKSVAFS